MPEQLILALALTVPLLLGLLALRVRTRPRKERPLGPMLHQRLAGHIAQDLARRPEDRWWVWKLKQED